MKRILSVLILCACLMTACQSGDNAGTGSSPAPDEASAAEGSQSEGSSPYQVTNNYSGIYEGTLTVDDFNDTTGQATVQKGASQQTKFQITYLDDEFGTIAPYDSTGMTTGSTIFTAKGNELKMFINFSEDETEVNKQEMNLTFEETDEGITASGTMEIAQGEDWIKGTVVLKKTAELPDSSQS
ncbi:MAG: hypothetical protein HFE85_00060 [Clostridiales bacterium]|nr:hypothetical protein [Clostridiales bacterium]